MKYNSYYLYKKCEKRDSQDVLPCIPPVYSIDGNGTMPKVIHTSQDPECGDIPWQYRWVNMDINTDYWCESCSPDYSRMYFTTVGMEDNVIISHPYSFLVSFDDGESWLSENSVKINGGQRILWKGSAVPSSYDVGIGSFSSTGKFYVEGNIMSLLFGDSFIGKTDFSDTFRYKWAFSALFEGCTNLMDAENLALPATALTEGCYSVMFASCSALAKTPQLPSATLADSCYLYMFENCTSLTTVTSNYLSATTLAEGCYEGMFKGCTSLTTVPQLSATTLAEGCYEQMFSGCTSLTIAPVLPATTLVSDCYRNMFDGCSNLGSITCLATSISPWTSTNNWVNGVSSTGTFIKNADMTSWTTGNSGIPTGWTIINA